MQRRRLLLAGLLLSPLAAGLAACARDEGFAPGMLAIKWDRDTCARCGMVISDRRFAAQLRGGPDNTAFKFDDIGCVSFWLRDKAAQYPWAAEATTRIWVADALSTPARTLWLDARQARFEQGRISPMGYNFAALGAGEGIDFAAMRERVLAKGK